MNILIEKFYGQTLAMDSEFLSRLDRNFARLAQRRKDSVIVPIAGSNYTITNTDDIVVYTGTGGQTYYLPNATTHVGLTYYVKHAGTGVLTVDATGKGGLFSSAGLVNSVTMATGDGALLKAANGTWQIS